MRFDSPNCQTNYTKYETDEFSLTWDEDVCLDAQSRIIGNVSAIETEDPLEQVSVEFRQYLDLMRKPMAEALPKHTTYDCKLDLVEGSSAPWGPIYPLSETELQAL